MTKTLQIPLMPMERKTTSAQCMNLKLKKPTMIAKSKREPKLMKSSKAIKVAFGAKKQMTEEFVNDEQDVKIHEIQSEYNLNGYKYPGSDEDEKHSQNAFSTIGDVNTEFPAYNSIPQK